MVAADVSIGNIEVRVPDGVAVSGSASADIGRVASNASPLPGFGGQHVENSSFGFGDPGIDFSIPGTDGEVVLDLEVNVGNIEVHSR